MSDHDIQTSPAPGGSSKLPLLIGGLILLVALALGAWVTFNGDSLFGSPVKKVGSIDQEKIFTLDAFKNAEKQLEAFGKKKKDELEAFAKKPGVSQAEIANMVQKFQLEVQQERNRLFNPLQTRAEAAVATVARTKGLTVILDKRIVVYGIPDITEEVVKVFQQEGELKLPAEQDTSTSPVAYFDQDVVRSLKVFQEADLQVFQKRNDLMREFEQRGAKLSPSEKEALSREFQARLEAFREQKMAPLFQKVSTSVNEVAKAQAISLVLDKQNVMYGGRNITEAVVDTFLQKVGQPEAASEAGASPAAATSPAAPASPAAGSEGN